MVRYHMSLKYQVTIYKEQPVNVRYHRHYHIHRVDGAASIWADGDMFWYQYGQPHRIGGPTEVSPVHKSTYHIRGILYTREEYDIKIRNILR